MYKKIKKAFNYISAMIRSGILYKWPFLFSVLEIEPTSANIMVTGRCNLKCVMCRQWRGPHGEELATDKWKKIIKDLKKNGIKNIHFTGGEPLLRNDIVELVSYCADEGFTVGMTTNGLLLTEDILKRFVEGGLRSIVISIDALNGDYDEIRGIPDSFVKVKKAASMISQIRARHNIDASINFTLMRNTIKGFGAVKKFADEVCLPVAICLLDKTSGIFKVEENKRDFWITEDDEKELKKFLICLKREKMEKPGSLLLNFPAIEYIEDYFKDPLQKNIPCTSSQDRVVIDPYGNLLGGCLSMGTFGSVKTDSFDILRRDKKYKIAKRNMFYKICPGCSCGYLFNIKSFPSLFMKDLIMKVNYTRTGSHLCGKRN